VQEIVGNKRREPNEFYSAGRDQYRDVFVGAPYFRARFGFYMTFPDFSVEESFLISPVLNNIFPITSIGSLSVLASYLPSSSRQTASGSHINHM
jgi:hypothetical protein